MQLMSYRFPNSRTSPTTHGDVGSTDNAGAIISPGKCLSRVSRQRLMPAYNCM